jgi:hypothetical protein
MYEMSQRHLVWVAENRVKPCNSVQRASAGMTSYQPYTFTLCLSLSSDRFSLRLLKSLDMSISAVHITTGQIYISASFFLPQRDVYTSHDSVQGRNVNFENTENKLKKVGRTERETVGNIDRKKEYGRQTELKADRRTR